MAIKVAYKGKVGRVTIKEMDKNRLGIYFPFNRNLLNWVKTLEGRRFNWDKKFWHIPDTERNAFRIQYARYCADKSVPNPYERFDTSSDEEVTSHRPITSQQQRMIQFIRDHRTVIIAAYMGTGKTLATIEAMERYVTEGSIWYVSNRSANLSVKGQLIQWESERKWEQFTFEGLQKHISIYEGTAPQALIVDECHKIKNPKALRSKACDYVAQCVRKEWGDQAYIVGLSGTPMPKEPIDWWHQAEVCQPGFLPSANIHVLKQRLCLIEERENLTGGVYPHIVTWWDDENKCAECGAYKDEHDLDISVHTFKKSINEVEKLGQRLNGLALRVDRMDFPREYSIESLRPSSDLVKVAKAIKDTGESAVKVLSQLRQISDGFIYKNKDTGLKEPCGRCGGSGEETYFDDVSDTDQEAVAKMRECTKCGGTGEQAKFDRVTEFIGSPKIDYLRQELHKHEDIGRLIIWAAFTGSINIIRDVALEEGWAVIQNADNMSCGFLQDASQVEIDDILPAMDYSHSRYDEYKEIYPRLLFLGNPQAGCEGINLTASPTTIFYSNVFNFDMRDQAEARGLRLGMPDWTHNIVDLVVLKSDKLVIDNLKQKNDFNKIIMSQIEI